MEMMLASAGVALLPTLEPAVERPAVVPAAHVLQQVAADRRDVAQLRRGGRVRGQRQRPAGPIAEPWVALEVGQRRQRADVQLVPTDRDAAQPQPTQADQPIWAGQLI